MASVRSRTRFVKSSKRGGGGGRGGGNSAGFERRYKTKTVTSGTLLTTEATSAEEKFERVRQGNAIDDQMGFLRYDSGPKKVGWLVNMQPTTLEVEGTSGKAGVDFYFLDGEGDSFKATVIYDPYFLIATKPGTEGEVEEWLRRKFEGLIKKTSRTTKEDLSMVATALSGRECERCMGTNNMPLAESSLRLPTDVRAIGFRQCYRFAGGAEGDHANRCEE